MTISIRALLNRKDGACTLVGLNEHHTSKDEFNRVMALLLGLGSINAVDVDTLDLIVISLSKNNELTYDCIGNLSSEKTYADCYSDVAVDAGWLVTDIDCIQIAKHSDDLNTWTLSQAVSLQKDSKFADIEIVSGEVEIDSIDESEIESLMEAYGYSDSVAQMREEYGVKSFNLTLAEMYFETEIAN